MNGLITHNFAGTLPLANRLQSKEVDIASALSHATNVIETLTALRSAAESSSREVFCDTHALAAKWISRSHVAHELWVAKLTDNPNQSINQSIRKIFNVSRITNVIARSTET